MTSTTSAQPRYHTAQRYTDRTGKAAYIAGKYAPILVGRVLDVGCDQRQLRSHLPAAAGYHGVDMNPAADTVLNLEEQNLPFDDGAFDTVICADVLEHLERLHGVFDELCRVSKSRVIISLPNPVRNLMLAIAQGSQGNLKYYGLPVDKPADRHKWFFGAEEAAHFLKARGDRNGFDVEQIDVEETYCPPWLGTDGADRLNSHNCRGGTTWCVLKRR